MFRIHLPAAATVLVAAGVGVGAAHATPVQIYGGGGGTSAAELRQAEDCFGNPTPLVTRGADNTHPVYTPVNAFNWIGDTKSAPLNCATSHIDTSVTLNYLSAGAGRGIAGIYSHDASKYWGDSVVGTSPSPYPSVHYSLSPTSLAQSDVGVYNNGGTEGSGSSAVTVTAPGVSPGAGQYANPQQQYGALIQYPLVISPLAIAYAPVYKKVRQADGTVISYKFKIKTPNADGSGGLRLDLPAYCGILNGVITNWNDPALTALNGGVSLKDPTDPSPFNVPIELVGRSDSSGATSIFTRALAAQCVTANGYSGTNAYADSSPLLPAALQGPVYSSAQDNNTVTPVAGKFTQASANEGVAKYLGFYLDPGPNTGDTITQGRIGYLGTDYVLPFVTNTGANTYGLNQAALKHGTKFLAANPKNAAAAFSASYLPPETSSTGVYTPGTGTTRRNQPWDWVEPNSKTSPLAYPANLAAYPIVGTVNYLGYTCYADSAVAAKLKAFLTFSENNTLITNKLSGLLASSGFSALPTAWTKAITQTFITPTTSGTAPTKALHLYVSTAGSSADTQCTTVTPGA